MTWLAKFGEWTSVSEGLPTNGTNVILLLGSGEVSGGWYARYGYGSSSFYEGRRGGEPFPNHAVIAWMPMPAAPSTSPEPGPEPS